MPPGHCSANKCREFDRKSAGGQCWSRDNNAPGLDSRAHCREGDVDNVTELILSVLGDAQRGARALDLPRGGPWSDLSGAFASRSLAWSLGRAAAVPRMSISAPSRQRIATAVAQGIVWLARTLDLTVAGDRRFVTLMQRGAMAMFKPQMPCPGRAASEETRHFLTHLEVLVELGEESGHTTCTHRPSCGAQGRAVDGKAREHRSAEACDR